MAARAISSATISFGLVSIPVKLYTTTESSGQISFNMLHQCGTRVKQQYWCPQDEKVVPREEMVKGYEFAKGKYVTFTAEELKALEAEASELIEIKEFLPLDQVDPLHFERAYYLGPDKGGDKPYALLSAAMEKTGRCAIASWAARGKQYIVLLRPFQRGLILEQLRYADELRSFDEVQRSDANVSDAELSLAEKLIEQIAVLYAEELTLPEINAIVAFYRSPVGLRFAGVQQKVLRESMLIGQRWGERIGRDLEQEARRELRRRGVDL